MDSSNSGSTSNDLSTKSQLYPSPPTNVDINDMTTGVSGDKYELNAFLKDATPIPTEDDTQNAHSITQNHTEVTDDIETDPSGDKYELNAFLKDATPIPMEDDTQNAHSITQNHTEVTDDIETDPSKNKDISNKDRRRMNRVQSGTTGNKYQNAQRFPGGHNKANESRDKPTAVVNPLSDNNGGEKKTVGNSKETKGGYRQYRDNFVHKETDDYVYFWRQDSPFSQWHPSEFTIDGLKFNCAEQYMMYNKARFANCEALMIAILNEPNPDVQKDYGRKVPNLDFDGWYSVSSDIVRKGNRAKFSQNEHLKEKLFSTYPKKLVEASPHDQIWGIGLHADDPRALNESKWRGTNLLGRILTEVRDELLDETGFLAKKE